jgi:hypothetical protein
MADSSGSSGAPEIRWRIDFTSERPHALDVAWALQAVETATVAGAWMSLALTPDASLLSPVLSSVTEPSKAFSRFFPSFGGAPGPAAVELMQAMDPFDPLDIGVLTGLNSWLRNTLLDDPAAYEAVFEFATVQRIGNESPLVVLILIPPAVKGGAALVAGAGAVAKGIHKYFQIKKTRAQIREADAGSRESDARAREADAKAREADAKARQADDEAALARARAEETRARTEAIRQQMRRDLAEQGIQQGIADDLAGEVDAPPDAVQRAAELGAKNAETVIGQLESNPAVADVSVESEQRAA